MNLTDLRVFASAARQPSLAAAAAELHLTPSAVSKALRCSWKRAWRRRCSTVRPSSWCSTTAGAACSSARAPCWRWPSRPAPT
ncbi:LysR family transcriptional regulator [Massilia sp. B-10]|nr:LysR family transcriptional regulator [Massilia sp. B-10]